MSFNSNKNGSYGIFWGAVMVFVLFGSGKVWSQHIDQPIPYFAFSKGLSITAPDSVFSMNLRFRMQNRVGVQTDAWTGEALADAEFEAYVRRLRLRLDGFVLDSRFNYVVQLSFSRSDMDWENTQFPNVIRDAMFFYRPTKKLQIGFGQGKLPGNRQRIVSSGDMQMPDRSLFNSVFQIDRDFGLNFYYNNKIGTQPFSIRACLSGGNGRNIEKTDALAYSARMEWYPLGAFTNGGDYFEGDLEREVRPKVSVASAFSYNTNATRTGGSIGKELYEVRHIRSLFVDVLYKHRGWALAGEFALRNTLAGTSPVTFSSQDTTQSKPSIVYQGTGYNLDGSYVFRNRHSLVLRFSHLDPSSSIKAFQKPTTYWGLGWGRYLKGHRLKWQSELGQTLLNVGASSTTTSWVWRFQIEAGI